MALDLTDLEQFQPGSGSIHYGHFESHADYVTVDYDDSIPTGARAPRSKD